MGASPELVVPSQWEEEVSHAVLICIFQMLIIHNVANKRQNLGLIYCCNLSNAYNSTGDRANTIIC